MQLDPVCFILSGDLTNEGDIESYEHLAELIEEINAFGKPVLLGLGNHDNRVNFRRIVLRETEAEDEDVPYYYATQLDGLRILMLDSKVPGRHDGELDQQQLAWLAEHLETPSVGGDLVVVHHPSVPRGVPRPDDLLLRNADDLAAAIEGKNVIAILAGHSHVSSVSSFRGNLHVTAPATAFLLDPSIRDGGRALVGAGFNICTVREGRLVVNPIILAGPQHEAFRYGAFAAATQEPVAVGASEDGMR
jgi:3',5'-cyclic AMP phosphodiesterase CpdA